MELNVESSIAFTEANGCLLIEVSPANVPAFEKRFTDLPFNKIGKVTADPVLKISRSEIPVDELVHAFNHPNHL